MTHVYTLCLDSSDTFNGFFFRETFGNRNKKHYRNINIENTNRNINRNISNKVINKIKSETKRATKVSKDKPSKMCCDRNCHVHGTLKARGRTFEAPGRP